MNAGKAQREAAEAAKAKDDAKIFDEAPMAPRMAEDAAAFGDVKFEGERLDDSSIELDKDLDEYSKAKQKAIEEYENYSNPKISKFVNDVLSGKNTEKGILLNNVSDEAADIIGKLTGVDVHGFKTGLEDRIVKHINERHGKNGSADQSMSNLSDLERIQYVIDNFDSIEHSGRSNSYTTIKKNGFPALAQTVTYSKAINGTFYVVEAVPDTKAKTLQIVSAFIETKKKGDDSSHNAEIDQAETSETYSAAQPFDDSISYSTSDVNTVISGMGSMGRTLYNKIVTSIAKDAAKAEQVKAAREGFAHVYEAGQKSVPYKRSQAKGLHIKEINAIYEAGKKDAAARVKVKKKTDAKVIKDASFKKAKVSKRTERILDGVSKIIGRDIRFSDEIKGNAKIDLENGEIIISTKAKSGHTWAMIHEVYHALVMDSPAEAEQLKKTVLDIAKKHEATFRNLLKEYHSAYASELYDENGNIRADAGEYLTEEMVADLIGYTLSEPAILEKLTGQQRNVLQRFLDKLVSMFGNEDAAAKKEYFGRFGDEYRAIFKDVAKEADSIAEGFKAALDRSKTAKESTVTGNGVRESRDVSEALSEVVDSFSIKNVNDAIHVQRMVFDTLSSEGFFTSGENRRIVKNKNTKAVIEINKSGIQETFGKSDNFANLSKRLKYLKLTTIRDIPNLLENAVLVEKNVKNKHKENSSVLFDYYSAETIVDANPITVEFDIKKSPQKNKFWVHRINIKENAEVNSSGADALKRRPNLDVDNSISKDNGNVNRYSKDLSNALADKKQKSKNPLDDLLSERFNPKNQNAKMLKEIFEDSRSMDSNDIRDEDGKLRNGTVVYAFDRDNFGWVTGYDYDEDAYWVYFISPEGYEAEPLLHSSDVKPVKEMYFEPMPRQFDDEHYEQREAENRAIETLEEIIEVERIVQQIKSSDDLSDADVQAIRQEIIQNRRQHREQLLAEIATTNLERWGAELGRKDDGGKVLSINEAIKKVEESFGLKVTSGGDASVSGSNISSYNESTRTIRTKFKNDLPAVCHALGYHIDKALGVIDRVIEQTAEVRKQNGNGIGALEGQLLALAKYDGKDSRKAIKEGFAEFIRMYLVSKNLAQEAAPIFYSEFESILKEDANLQAAVEKSAEAVHGYFEQSAGERGGAAIMTAEDWKQLNKPRGKEAIRNVRDWVIVRLFDRFYGIKSAEKEHNVFDLSTSKTAYVKATLSLTARAKAARLLESGFYDANGNKVGEGFFGIIEELGAEYTDKFKAFGDYLSFVHALEWIEPNKLEGRKTSSGKDIYNAKARGKVFADETLNDATELKRLIADMEAKYSDFKSIAKRIYKYQDNLMEYYLIPSGALSRDQAEAFRAQYPHYVPFNRFNTVFGEATKSGKGGQNYFGNLRNPIQRADGGNAPIRHPLESIINSTFSAVDFYMKNDTMLAMIEEFTGNGALPGVMERIYSTKELEKLEEKGRNPFEIEKTTTKTSHDRNCEALISMNSVADLKGNELDGDTPLNEKLSLLFEKWGNEVSTARFGTVALTKSSVRSELRHGLTRDKITSFAAIREVLQKGVVIDNITKNNGELERIVVAAPITISGNPYFMGVMIQKDVNTNRLYLHDVVIKKETPASQTQHLSTTGAVENQGLHMTEILERAISIGNSISQQNENVNVGFNERTETAFSPVIDKEKGIVYAWVNGVDKFTFILQIQSNGNICYFLHQKNTKKLIFFIITYLFS